MAKLRLAQSRALLFWKQKANIKWMREGDANTRFFHQTVKERRRRQCIRRITCEYMVACDSQQDIENEVIRYYQTLFTGGQTERHDDILQYIPWLVSDDENSHLLSLSTLEEVKQAVWDLSPTSAAGPDGFPGSF